MKKLVTMFLTGILSLSLLIPAGCGNVSRYFDLSDEKIPFNDPWLDIKPDDRFKDTIYICLKKQLKTIKLTVKDFNNSNIVSLEYINFKPDRNRSDDKEYIDNFRQDLCLQLTDVTNGEVKIIIHEIEELEFVKKISIIRAVND